MSKKRAEKADVVDVILRGIAVLLALMAIAFIVTFFVFAFTAALRPGGPDPESDAAGVAFIGVVVSAALAAGALLLNGDL